MKSLNDVKYDMSALYDSLRDGGTDLRLASELANVAGKFLKAEQLALAREIFARSLTSRGRELPAPDAKLIAGDES
jgi:hypothetical protein